MTLFTHGHALLIGVGSYQNEKWNAPITVADAEAVANALRDPLVGAYPPKHVTLLHDAAATTAGVTAALMALATRTTAQDTVFIFFCGHGMLDEHGVYCFATHDTVFVGKIIKAGSGLSAPDLLALLRAIPAQKLLLVVNACFSGYLNPTLGGEVLGAPVAATLGPEVLATGEGRALITASRPTQYSHYLRNATHTFFGQALVDGLRGAAARGGQVGLYDLYQHVYSQVKQQVATAVHKEQEPVLTITQGVGAFPLARAAAGSTNLGAPLQEPPSNTAVEVYPRSVVQAWGQGAQAAVAHGGNVDQSKLIDFGSAQIKGGISIGDVAGRDITKITVNVNAASVAQAQDTSALLAQIAKAKDAVEQLADAPKGQRRDIAYALDSAHEAGGEGDNARLLEKLAEAQAQLLKLSATVPTARPLSDTVGALIQQAMGILPPPGNRTHTQNISGNAQVGVAVAGDVHGGITLNQPQGDVVQNKVVNYGAPRPADTNPDHLRRLIDINTRRLRVLEEQAGRFGYNTPPHIQTEIEDVRAEIARLEVLLEK